MKRIVTWLLSTISVVVLLFGYHTSTAGSLAASPQSSVVSGSKATTTTSGAGGGSGSGSGGSGNRSASGSGSRSGSGTAHEQTAKTSTVTGPTVNTQWGPVQVQLTVAGNKITDVSILQYPNANGRDIQIANYALPILIQSTLDAQSANIDMVSGATFTSYGYLQSLQGALDQAGL